MKLTIRPINYDPYDDKCVPPLCSITEKGSYCTSSAVGKLWPSEIITLKQIETKKDSRYPRIKGNTICRDHVLFYEINIK